LRLLLRLPKMLKVSMAHSSSGVGMAGAPG
jgi:hypothetical protein